MLNRKVPPHYASCQEAIVREGAPAAKILISAHRERDGGRLVKFGVLL